MKNHRWGVAPVVALSLFSSFSAWAGDIRESARVVAERSRRAVVTIRLVIKLKQNYMGQSRDQEHQLEVNGTVIDPLGLTVTAASLIDPTSVLKTLVGSTLGGTKPFSLDSEVKETAILLEDGTEVEADVVLKDTDLDMAFIRPHEPSRQFDAVALKPHGVALRPLDPIFVIGRLGKIGNRATTVTLGSVRAVVKGPRTFYVCDNEASLNLGCVAYDSAGELLGIFLTKQRQEFGGEAGVSFLTMFMGGAAGRDAVMPILRPVEDIIEIADQAKKAKVPQTKEPRSK